MSYYTIDLLRENDPHALADVEVFEHTHGYVNGVIVKKCEDPCCEPGEECGGPGFYYAYGFPGCLWDSDPVGPFGSEALALADARGGE